MPIEKAKPVNFTRRNNTSNEQNLERLLKNRRRKSLPNPLKLDQTIKLSLFQQSPLQQPDNSVLFKPIKSARSIESELQLSRELDFFLHDDQKRDEKEDDADRPKNEFGVVQESHIQQQHNSNNSNTSNNQSIRLRSSKPVSTTSKSAGNKATSFQITTSSHHRNTNNTTHQNRKNKTVSFFHIFVHFLQKINLANFENYENDPLKNLTELRKIY